MLNKGGNRDTTRLLMDRSVPGRVGVVTPGLDVPAAPLPDAAYLRDDLPLPEVSEPEVVQYFTSLSQLNFSIDTHFYPLGSCTMKYNPKINDEVAFLPGFAGIHPQQPAEQSQGALELLYRLQDFLTEVTGMAATSLPLSPAPTGAGRRAHDARVSPGPRRLRPHQDGYPGQRPRHQPRLGGDGRLRRGHHPVRRQRQHRSRCIAEIAGDDLAGVMITLPSTLGLFDTNVLEVCQIVHDCGGLVYGDGANMNALLGRAKLGELGFDVCHLNLHKTFSTPHGGGGPGAGPVCCGENLAPYLAAPVVAVNDDGEYSLVEPEQSIGKISGFHGNFGVLVRAYTYIRTLGAAGLLSISGNAVLNANYIMESLKDIYELPYDRTCMHEVVFSADRQRERGVSGLEVAKAAPGLRFPRADDVLPVDRPRSPDDRAHRVGNQGNAGRVHRRPARHRLRGNIRARTGPARPAHHAGFPA